MGWFAKTKSQKLIAHYFHWDKHGLLMSLCNRFELGYDSKQKKIKWIRVKNWYVTAEKDVHKQYVQDILYAINKPQGIITHLDLMRYLVECAEAAKPELPLGISLKMDINTQEIPFLAKVKITFIKQSWFRRILASIGLFFIKISRQEIEVEE